MALVIARLKPQLLAAGWRVLTSEEDEVAKLSDKVRLAGCALISAAALLPSLPIRIRVLSASVIGPPADSSLAAGHVRCDEVLCDGEKAHLLFWQLLLRDHAEAIGMLSSLPEHYSTAEGASYPCILKAAQGEHGRNVFIVHSAEEVQTRTSGALGTGSGWLLQELIRGRLEHSVSMLVNQGKEKAVSTPLPPRLKQSRRSRAMFWKKRGGREWPSV